MKAFLKKFGWKKAIKNWIITDCVIRSRDVYHLCLRPNKPYDSMVYDHDIPVRFTSMFLDSEDSDKQWSYQDFIGFKLPVIGAPRIQSGIEQGLMVAKNDDGDVAPRGGELSWPIEHIQVGGRPYTQRIKCIEGFAYAVCAFRKIYKRTAIGKWEVVYPGVPAKESSTKHGFNDLAAFNHNDMYAVGGMGDAWHFDGKNWSQLPFPSKEQLSTVVCAGDGQVYIGGEGCSIWRGRGEQWVKIVDGGSTILWNDMVWFNNQLWASSDYQFKVWDGKALIHPQYEDDGKIADVPMYGHMDAYDGLLVIASPHHVWGFDGKSWTVLIAPYD